MIIADNSLCEYNNSRFYCRRRKSRSTPNMPPLTPRAERECRTHTRANRDEERQAARRNKLQRHARAQNTHSRQQWKRGKVSSYIHVYFIFPHCGHGERIRRRSNMRKKRLSLCSIFPPRRPSLPIK